MKFKGKNKLYKVCKLNSLQTFLKKSWINYVKVVLKNQQQQQEKNVQKSIVWKITKFIVTKQPVSTTLILRTW